MDILEICPLRICSKASAVLFAVCASLASCAGGDPASTEGGGAIEPKLSVLDREIFKSACTAPCHSGGPDVAAGGLDMSTGIHKALVGAFATASACKSTKLQRVAAGSPDESLLYIKVTAKRDNVDPVCGTFMPQALNDPPLSDAAIEAIRVWIEGGAKDN